MTDKHPIVPPPDKIHNWLQLENVDYTLGQIITVAAQWGADQELEACCEWLVRDWEDMWISTKLRAARRPKPPSLKEQALKALSEMEDDCLMVTHSATIRRALEFLPDDINEQSK